ncbi:hypothetical protein [Petropleomorpha daqingensis]|uniref:NADH:ubiquinone oxidoreductase subunit 3 (Subunit A) n=1 Tax=Petropleomorpha daqingensis TaxID=2026353 RepID=A0A853CGZ3_9ACTN|nr:hypothetical protein [Petropleomorpha daqingensis]NYJ06727.1 NADH:ubiquinone oxidoreductase subunit 3 (subunit A) [Petropleomorpha daqingensis]
MPWWAWLLLIWAVLATAAGLLLGAVAARARARERAARAAAYESARPESSSEHRHVS